VATPVLLFLPTESAPDSHPCFTLPSHTSHLSLIHLLSFSDHDGNASTSSPAVNSIIFRELIVAIVMAEKHETAPTVRLTTTKAFRETIRIGSASSWDKNILNLFHVAFEKDSFADLRWVVESRYFEPPDDDEEARNRNSLSTYF
jgi:hypothetical protein